MQLKTLLQMGYTLVWDGDSGTVMSVNRNDCVELIHGCGDELGQSIYYDLDTEIKDVGDTYFIVTDRLGDEYMYYLYQYVNMKELEKETP